MADTGNIKPSGKQEKGSTRLTNKQAKPGGGSQEQSDHTSLPASANGMPPSSENDSQPSSANDMQPSPATSLQPSSKNGLQPSSNNGLQPAPGDGQHPTTAGSQHLDNALRQTITPQEFLRQFSSGARLITLDRLGVHVDNRKAMPLIGSNVVELMHRFRKGSKGGGEDFAEYRYRPARAVEPDPNDPQATLRHTNEMASKDSRIRGVQDTTNNGLYGLFSKSHLWSAVYGMEGCCVRQNGEPDAPVFEPPKGQEGFDFVLQHGLWVEVVSWEAVSYTHLTLRTNREV